LIEQHLNSLKRLLAYRKSPYPTKYLFSATTSSDDDDDDDGDVTVGTSNTTPALSDAAHHLAFGMMVDPALAIADTGATSIFFDQGCPMFQQMSHFITNICDATGRSKNCLVTHM
jgi:hypothetical protein